MTARELICELKNILEEYDGEDLQVRFDHDFLTHYGIEEVTLLQDLENEEDMVLLRSPECLQAMEQYGSAAERQSKRPATSRRLGEGHHGGAECPMNEETIIYLGANFYVGQNEDGTYYAYYPGGAIGDNSDRIGCDGYESREEVIEEVKGTSGLLGSSQCPMKTLLSTRIIKVDDTYVHIQTTTIRDGYQPLVVTLAIKHNGQPEETAAGYHELISHE